MGKSITYIIKRVLKNPSNQPQKHLTEQVLTGNLQNSGRIGSSFTNAIDFFIMFALIMGITLCDIVLYNKCISGLHSRFWHRSPKTLGISKVMRLKKVILLC